MFTKLLHHEMIWEEDKNKNKPTMTKQIRIGSPKNRNSSKATMLP